MTNGVLYEAFTALQEPLRVPAPLAWRLAQNRIALRPIWEALEEAKRVMLGDLANISPPYTREETAALNKLEGEWKALLAEASPITPTLVPVALSAFPPGLVVSPGLLSALVAAGIVVEADPC